MTPKENYVIYSIKEIRIPYVLLRNRDTLCSAKEPRYRLNYSNY
jgi:hypothetical protein